MRQYRKIWANIECALQVLIECCTFNWARSDEKVLKRTLLTFQPKTIILFSQKGLKMTEICANITANVSNKQNPKNIAKWWTSHIYGYFPVTSTLLVAETLPSFGYWDPSADVESPLNFSTTPQKRLSHGRLFPENLGELRLLTHFDVHWWGLKFAIGLDPKDLVTTR